MFRRFRDSRARDDSKRRDTNGRRLITPACHAVEALEARRLLTYTITVNSTNDDASTNYVTLRDAIDFSNRGGSLSQSQQAQIQSDANSFNTIQFSITGQTITLLSPLPFISRPVTIDGSNGGVPGVAIDGSSLKLPLYGDGLDIYASNCTIRGLAIGGFDGDGILVDGNTSIGGGLIQNINIEHNYIGTDLGGEVPLANGAAGVHIESATNVHVGGDDSGTGNVIGAAGGDGIFVGSGASSVAIENNHIGTDATGATNLGSAEDGILISALFGSTNYAHDNTIKNNVISWCGGNGINLTRSSGNTIVGNYIGTDSSGNSALPNGGQGILVYEASGNVIGGTSPADRNIIAGNAGDGVQLFTPQVEDPSVPPPPQDVSNNIIQGNWIGIGADGRKLGNRGFGVSIVGDAASADAFGNTIGGAAAGAGNVISANGLGGIDFEGRPHDNVVYGNYIGTTPDGAGPLGNTGDGIVISGGFDNAIGGSGNGQGNVISANSGNGNHVSSAYSSTIAGNLIGTDVSATKPLGNHLDGILLDNGASGTIIGGSAGAANVISANQHNGIEITGIGTDNNLVQANFIGTDRTAKVTTLGNAGDGVRVEDASNNTVGAPPTDLNPGTTSGNQILYNSGYGVEVAGQATGVTVRGNAIYNNVKLGINLEAAGDLPDGVTPNDDQNLSRPGPNDLLNFPVGVSAEYDSASNQTVITGVLIASRLDTKVVDLYETDPADPFGRSGETYLGSSAVNPNGTFECILPGYHSPYVTATATDTLLGDTSEFGPVAGPDTSGDGIPDYWKTNGIDFNGDEKPDITLPDAQVGRTDVYVQYDWMTGLRPDSSVINAVTAAFANAPADASGGTSGVALHLIEAKEVPFSAVVEVQDPAAAKAKGYPYFPDLVASNFGFTGDSHDARRAESLVYRYVLFGTEVAKNGDIKNRVGGITYAGDDGGMYTMMALGTLWQLALNQVAKFYSDPGLPYDIEARALMHELGHQFGLDHGGSGDPVDNKPNYLSVMNDEYTWEQAGYAENLGAYGISNKTIVRSTVPLDYSRQALPTLQEDALIEANGIGGRGGIFIRYIDSNIVTDKHGNIVRDTQGNPVIGFPRIGPSSGPVDWNGNDKIDPSLVEVNLLGPGNGVNTPLSGAEDWSQLKYDFRESGKFLRSNYALGAVEASVPSNDIENAGMDIVQYLNGALANPDVATLGVGFDGVVTSFLNDGPDPAAAYTALIDWGDGTHSTGTISATSTGFAVSGAHAYTSDGVYRVAVTATDGTDGSQQMMQRAIYVAAPMTVQGTMIAGYIAGSAGVQISGVVATFSDPNLLDASSDYIARIDWGDGQTDSGTVVPQPGGGFAVTGTHQFSAAGDYSAAVTIEGPNGDSGAATSTIHVVPAVVVSGIPGRVINSPGSALASLQINDPNITPGDLTAVLRWNDPASGATRETPAAIFSAAGSTKVGIGIPFPGPLQQLGVDVIVRDNNGNEYDGTTTIDLDDLIRVTVHDMSLVSGAPFSGIVASFNPSTLSSNATGYTAGIDWGDGTSSQGTVQAAAAGFQVLGSHTYSTTLTAAPDVKVTVSDAYGQRAVGYSGLEVISQTPLPSDDGTQHDPNTGEVTYQPNYYADLGVYASPPGFFSDTDEGVYAYQYFFPSPGFDLTDAAGNLVHIEGLTGLADLPKGGTEVLGVGVDPIAVNKLGDVVAFTGSGFSVWSHTLYDVASLTGTQQRQSLVGQGVPVTVQSGIVNEMYGIDDAGDLFGMVLRDPATEDEHVAVLYPRSQIQTHVSFIDTNNDGIPDTGIETNGINAPPVLVGVSVAGAPPRPMNPSQPVEATDRASQVTQLFKAAVNNNQLPLETAFVVYGPDGSPVMGLYTLDGVDPSVDAGDGPVGLEPSDFNNDGFTDLAIVNSLSNNVSIALGDGSGGFAEPIQVPVGNHPSALAVADFNGDHIPDLAVTNAGDGTITLLYGNGDGTFGKAQTVALPISAPSSVTAADLNGDGAPDLVICDGNSSTISVLMNDGRGHFVQALQYDTGSTATAVMVMDLNGDGKLDLVATIPSMQAISVLLGNGDGTFRPAQLYALGFVPGAVTALDANGDGRPDLLVTDSASHQVSLLTNTFATLNAKLVARDTAGLTGPVGTAITGTLADFVSADPFASASEFQATVHFSADSSDMPGEIVSDGNGQFHVVVSRSFAQLGDSTALVTITDAQGDMVYATSPIQISNEAVRPVLIISVQNSARQYGQTNPMFDLNYAGFVNGDTPASLGGSAVFTTSATSGGPVGDYDVTVSGLTDANYVIQFVKGALHVTAATPTVAVVAGGGTYTGSPFPATCTIAGVGSESAPAASLEGVIPTLTYYAGTFTTVASLSGQTPLSGAPSGAGSYTVLASFAGSADYSGASALSNFSIAPYTLIATAAVQDKPYDGTTSANVMLSVIPLGGDSVTANYTSAAFSDKNVGTGKTVEVSGITLGGASAANYAFNTTAVTTGNITPELTIAGTAGSDSITLIQDTDRAHIDWFLNGSGLGQFAISDLSGLTINGTGGNDVINLDYSHGNPLSNILHLNGTFTINNLQGSNPLAATTLEIGRSTVFISYANAASDPIAAIKGYLKNGYNNGGWNGTPTASTGVIQSAAAAANPNVFSIGYADNNDGTGGATVNPTANTIEVRYAAWGDTDFSNTVDLPDYNAVVHNFATGTNWDQGVVTFDGTVGLADYNAVVRNFGQSPSAVTAAQTPSIPSTSSAPSTSSGQATTPPTSSGGPAVPVVQANPAPTPAAHHPIPQKHHKRIRR